MAKSPKDNQERYDRTLNAWKTLTPTKSFAGLTLAEFEAQIADSNASRARLEALDDEIKQQQANREANDENTMNMCDAIVKSVVADPEYGDNSALYESMGYVRKSDRKSGLTRKKTEPVK